MADIKIYGVLKRDVESDKIVYGSQVEGGYFVWTSATLPTWGTAGQLLYCTADSKFYQYNGTAWVKAKLGGGGLICETAGATAAKVVEADGFSLIQGYLQIQMNNANSYNGKITLNINSTGAKDIWINGKVSSSSNKTLPAGMYLVYYDGTQFKFRTDGAIADKLIIGNDQTAAGYTFGTKELITKEYASASYLAKNSAITGATKCKITYDANGLVTSGADLTANDIPDLSATYVTLSDNQTISGTKKFSSDIKLVNSVDDNLGTITGKNYAMCLKEGKDNGSLYLDFTGPLYYNDSCGISGQVLTSNGDSSAPTWTTLSAGDVTGPTASTDNAIARFDGTTGKVIQNSAGTIDDNGNLSMTGKVTVGVDQTASGYTFGTKELITKEYASASYLAKNSAITGATKCKITYDANGLVTSGADLTANDIPDLSATYVTLSDNQTISGTKKFSSDIKLVNSVDVNLGTITGKNYAMCLKEGKYNGSLYLDFTGPLYYKGSCGTSGQVLTSNGDSSAPTWTTLSAGDVTGPTASTDNAIAVFSGTTGKVIKEYSGATIYDESGEGNDIGLALSSSGISNISLNGSSMNNILLGNSIDGNGILSSGDLRISTQEGGIILNGSLTHSGQSTTPIRFISTDNDYNAGYAKMPIGDGSTSENYYTIATQEWVKTLPEITVNSVTPIVTNKSYSISLSNDDVSKLNNVANTVIKINFSNTIAILLGTTNAWIKRDATLVGGINMFSCSSNDLDTTDAHIKKLGTFNISHAQDTNVAYVSIGKINIEHISHADNLENGGMAAIQQSPVSTAFDLDAREYTRTGLVPGANANYSSMFNGNSRSSGIYSTTFGLNTYANGYGAIAEGNKTYANGTFSHAFGQQASAIGAMSTAFGKLTIAKGRSQFVFGENNIEDDTPSGETDRGEYIEIVGNGTGDGAKPSNARTLSWEGNEWVQGKVTVGADQTASGYSWGTKELITKEYASASYIDKTSMQTITGNKIFEGKLYGKQTMSGSVAATPSCYCSDGIKVYDYYNLTFPIKSGTIALTVYKHRLKLTSSNNSFFITIYKTTSTAITNVSTALSFIKRGDVVVEEDYIMRNVSADASGTTLPLKKYDASSSNSYTITSVTDTVYEF